MFTTLPNGKNTDFLPLYKQVIAIDDSMTPFINRGDIVLIDTQAAPPTIQAGDLWLIHKDNTQHVVQVKIGTRGLILRHTNPLKPAYLYMTPAMLTNSAGNWQFVGKVMNSRQDFTDEPPSFFNPSIN